MNLESNEIKSKNKVVVYFTILTSLLLILGAFYFYKSFNGNNDEPSENGVENNLYQLISSAREYIIHEDKIFYINRDFEQFDALALYESDLNGNNIKSIQAIRSGGGILSRLVVNNNYLYVCKDKNSVYKINLDNHSDITILNIESADFSVGKFDDSGNYIYWRLGGDIFRYTVSNDTTDKITTDLVLGEKTSYFPVGKDIYYVKNNAIYKNSDGEVIFNGSDKVKNLVVNNDYLYFMNGDSIVKFDLIKREMVDTINIINASWQHDDRFVYYDDVLYDNNSIIYYFNDKIYRLNYADFTLKELAFDINAHNIEPNKLRPLDYVNNILIVNYMFYNTLTNEITKYDVYHSFKVEGNHVYIVKETKNAGYIEITKQPL